MGAKNMVIAGDYMGKPITGIGGVVQIYVDRKTTSSWISLAWTAMMSSQRIPAKALPAALQEVPLVRLC